MLSIRCIRTSEFLCFSVIWFLLFINGHGLEALTDTDNEISTDHIEQLCMEKCADQVSSFIFLTVFLSFVIVKIYLCRQCKLLIISDEI